MSDSMAFTYKKFSETWPWNEFCLLILFQMYNNNVENRKEGMILLLWLPNYVQNLLLDPL